MTVRLPKARVTLDIDHELLVWITTYAKEQGKSRNEKEVRANGLLLTIWVDEDPREC